MEFRYLRYFVTVADELHFTRAAERLGMAQPPLSQQIRKLEMEIGTPLFRRFARGVELTDAGRIFYEDALHILNLVDLAKNRAQSAARGLTGHIRVGFASSVVFHPMVARVVRAYRDAFPGVQLAPWESHISGLMNDLVEERIDVAVIRQASQQSENLKVEALLDEEMVVVLPSHHPLAALEALSMEMLREETLIMFPRAMAPVLHEEIISACLRAGFTPRLGQESSQVASAVSMVAAGFGVSIVPHSIKQYHAEGVTYRPIHGNAPRATIALAYRSAEHSHVILNFATIAKQVVAQEPPVARA